MPRGNPNWTKKTETPVLDAVERVLPPAAPVEQPKVNLDEMVAQPVMFPVKLGVNYVPKKPYNVIGYDRPEIKRKTSAGQMVVIQEAGFVAVSNETEVPPPIPGTGYAGRLWKGTTVEVPIDEAKQLLASKRAERADALPA